MSQCRSPNISLVTKLQYGGATGKIRTAERKETGVDSGRSFLDIAVDRYRPYRFVFAMENHIGDWWTGWSTERLVTAVLAGAVPIVAGTAATRAFLGQHINLERVLWCDMPSTNSLNDKRVPHFHIADPEARVRFVKADKDAAHDLSACADQIRRVDQNPRLWQHIVEQPLVTGSVNKSIFGLQRIASNLRNAICRDLESHLCAQPAARRRGARGAAAAAARSDTDERSEMRKVWPL